MLARRRIDYISLYLILTFFLIVGIFFVVSTQQERMSGKQREIERLIYQWDLLTQRTQALLISDRNLKDVRDEWALAFGEFDRALVRQLHSPMLKQTSASLAASLAELDAWWLGPKTILDGIKDALDEYLLSGRPPGGKGVYSLLAERDNLGREDLSCLTRILNVTNGFLMEEGTMGKMLLDSADVIEGEIQKKKEFRFKMSLFVLVVLCTIAFNINISSRRKIQKASQGFELMVAERTNDLAKINQRLKMEMAERVRMENQLMRSQKMESLGIVAGGVAHDFNNLLFGIMGNAELALLHLPPGSSASNNIENVVSLGQRAAELTKQMLDYSGRGRISLEAIDLSEAVKDMTAFLKSSIGKNTDLQFYLSEDLPSIEGDPGQINQVIMNLVTNASEAIGDHVGRITLSTGSTYCDRTFLERSYLFENQPEGDYVTLRVSDNGPGIDSGILGQIFDPFFTTKFTGRGLGLAAVLGIVRGQKGAVNINSTEGQGTTFTIFFPVMATTIESKTPDAVQATVSDSTRTVLVVDDESHVLEVIRDGLQSKGFHVMTASDGQDGLGIFKMHSQDIDLVLMDLTMPRMGGQEAFLEMQRLNPDIPVIVASGYSEEELTLRFEDQRPAGFIKKPFRLQALADVLNKVLAG